MQVQSLGWEDPLEEGMATHSDILAWRIPGTEEPRGLPSMGLQSQTRLKQLSSSSNKLNYLFAVSNILEKEIQLQRKLHLLCI